MKDVFLADGSIFRQVFYTTAMVYDRREQEPFPPVNVYFCGSRVLIQALLPGLELENIRMTIERDTVFLEGRMPRRKGHYIHEERYSGHFRRRIALGTEVSSQARMSIRDGILHIELQRKE